MFVVGGGTFSVVVFAGKNLLMKLDKLSRNPPLGLKVVTSKLSASVSCSEYGVVVNKLSMSSSIMLSSTDSWPTSAVGSGSSKVVVSTSISGIGLWVVSTSV